MLSGLVISLIMMMAVGMTAVAGESKTSSQDYLDSLNVGVEALLTPDESNGAMGKADTEEKEGEKIRSCDGGCTKCVKCTCKSR